MKRTTLLVSRNHRPVGEHLLARGITTVGRDRTNDVVLEHPQVSRFHALLTIDSSGRVALQDLGSRNGTHHGDRPVRHLQLSCGTQFSLGAFTCELQIEGAVAGISADSVASTTVDAADGSTGAAGQPVRFLGRSKPIRELLALVSRVAATRVGVLISGESGSGKGIIARMVHELGDRSSAPFVAVNCAAIPKELIESELFGHRKGAFTGAVDDRVGKFQAADGGTLFLDEVADMGSEAQAKILRALEEREIEPVGQSRPVRIDTRVIAASHRDLQQAIAAGSFRQDLYYRLAQFRLHVPPLRERPEDIALLAAAFLAELAVEIPAAAGSYFSSEALLWLAGHDWPGNVRELKNMVAQAAIAKDGPEIRVEHLSRPGAVGRSTARANTALAEVEARQVAAALERNDWNISQTANELGIARKTLRKRIRDFGLERLTTPL